ncbi:MAG: hypothetical protein WBW33_02040, partial [Bryobacteraceae bacterium]
MAQPSDVDEKGQKPLPYGHGSEAASGTTWTQLSRGKELESGAVIAGLQSRYGAGTATMQTVLYNQFGVQALN